jgi:hypothetical protein
VPFTSSCRRNNEEGHVIMTSQSANVLAEIAEERSRQIEREGWMPEHDDAHVDGSLALAAAAYARNASDPWPDTWPPPDWWPWAAEWWKPRDPRRDLVRSAALIVAEIERLDREEKRKAADRATPP